jgi:transcriptional regulator with XRE-family HTH domain
MEKSKFQEDTSMENTVEMKDRIAHIIRAKNLTAAEFAMKLGIQPSNISHLLAGRNNPSLDFVKKLKETFPEYSLEWIIFGKGPITVSEPFVGSVQTISDTKPVLQDESVEKNMAQEFVDLPLDRKQSDEAVSISDAVLKKIVLVYSDNTFEVLLPR